MQDRWPPLPLDGWRDTYSTLHMWTQVVGKICLALTPLTNHFWNIAFQITPRGLTTPTMTVADFYNAVTEQLRQLDIRVRIWTTPVEVPDPIPFERDTVHRTYEPAQ